MFQKIGLGLTFEQISRNLNVSESTACRIYSKFVQTGNVVAVAQPSREHCRVLNEHEELYVVGLILNKASLYLKEVCQVVSEMFHIQVSMPTICRILQRYGITRKKIRQVASQRSETLRGRFMGNCLLFSQDMFVFADETGSDNRNTIRKFGYALRGVTPICQRVLCRGRRVNAVSAISTNGVLATEIITSNATGDFFFDYLRGTLLPQMRAFDGHSARSILVLDNCAIHHISEVKAVAQQAGILLLFLPAYSPDLNPIEEAFSFVKQYLKEHDELLQATSHPTDVIKHAFDAITPSHCKSWISHAGYLCIYK